MATRKPKLTVRQLAVKNGWRSGFESDMAADLEARGVEYTYEEVKIEYEQPATKHKYTPDYQLANGIFIETKGRFMMADRKKHLLIQKQHPDIDIRFVFQSSRTKISKNSKTSYGDWCNKYGFKFADKKVPQDWIDEPAKQ